MGGALCAWAADSPRADLERAVDLLGGRVVRGPDGNIVEVSLARTWASDNDVERVADLKTLKRLDLSFTYVTDAGLQRLRQLPQLEELTLDATESITDAATSYLRANKSLRKLVLRGTDITDVGMPYLATLTNLKSLDLSHTMIGDVGLESLPALSELEELDFGGTRITGTNLNFLKLLPKLKKLSFNGIQRRNAGACWTPLITDLDLDTISLLSGLEDLNLGVGVSSGRTGEPMGEGNCRVTGGIQLTDLGVAKLAKLTKLRRLDISGAKITPAGLSALKSLPQLERLSLWNCKGLDDSAAPALAAFPKLGNLDLSYTSIGDATLKTLAALPNLKLLYLTDTKVTPAGVEAFRKQKPASFVSWAMRPAPIPRAPKAAKTKPTARRKGGPSETLAAGTFILARAVWAQEVNFFATKVYPVLEAARCRMCHTTAGVASGTRVHFPEKDATQNQIQLFGLSLSAVVDRSNPPNSLLVLKPTNESAHRRRAHQARLRGGKNPTRVGPISGDTARSRSRPSKNGSTKRRLRQASSSGSPPDAQPVRQHGARSARRLQPSGGTLSARRLRRRFQESTALSGHASAAGGRLQHVGREARAECFPRRRHQRI